MNLEGIASPPPRQPAELRYATLHRTIDGGLANDRVWADLVEVCAELGRSEEASRALEQIQEPAERRHARFRAGRHGVRLAAAGSDGNSARNTGPVVDTKPTPTVEHLGDAVRFLFTDHLPMTTIVATILLPLLLGLSGFLLTNVDASAVELFALLAASPAILVTLLVASLAGNTVREARRGLIDPPAIPRLGEMVRSGGCTLRDAGLILLAALAPAWITAAATGSTAIAIPMGLVLLSLAPMAFALRTTEYNWNCTRPGYLLSQIRRVRGHYPAVLLSLSVLFAPIAVALLVTAGSETFVALAATGLLGTGPVLIAARLLGLVLHEADRRDRKARAQATTAKPVATGHQKRVAKRRAPRERRAAEERTRRTPVVPEAETAPQREVRQTRRPQARPQARPQVHAQPEVETLEIGAASSNRGRLMDQPDIGHIPGASIVRRDTRR